MIVLRGHRTVDRPPGGPPLPLPPGAGGWGPAGLDHRLPRHRQVYSCSDHGQESWSVGLLLQPLLSYYMFHIPGYVFFEGDCFGRLLNPYIPVMAENASLAQVGLRNIEE